MSEQRSLIGKFIHSSWGNMNIRCANGKYYHIGRKDSRNNSYANIYIELSYEEYKKLCLENKELILSLKRPSVDRKNKNLGYNLSNIQFIELIDNLTKDVKTSFKDGKGICRVCKKEKVIDEFSKDKRKLNGRTSICKDCDRQRIRNLRYTGK